MSIRKPFGSALLAILLVAHGAGALGQDAEASAPCVSVDASFDSCLEIAAFANVAQQLADTFMLARGTNPIKFEQQVSMFFMDNLAVMSEVEGNLDLPPCTSLYDSVTRGSATDVLNFTTALIGVTYSKATSDSAPDTILNLTSFECAASCCGACTEGTAYAFWDGWLDDAYCALKIAECLIRSVACIATGAATVAGCAAVCSNPVSWVACAGCIAAGSVATEAVCMSAVECWKECMVDCGVVD